MQEYSVDDFLQSVHIKPVLAMGYHFDCDVDYIEFLHNLCSLEKVSPLFLYLNSDISKLLIDYISDKRFTTNNVDVINATNEFLSLYNVNTYRFQNLIYSNMFNKYIKLQNEFFTRFNSDTYFCNNYDSMIFKPNFIQLIKSFLDYSDINQDDNGDTYTEIVDKSSKELLDLEMADLYIVDILLQLNYSDKNDLLCRSLELCKLDARQIISSINYVLSKCPNLILSNIYGNYDFISSTISNFYIEDKAIKSLRRRLVRRLNNSL